MYSQLSGHRGTGAHSAPEAERAMPLPGSLPGAWPPRPAPLISPMHRLVNRSSSRVLMAGLAILLLPGAGHAQWTPPRTSERAAPSARAILDGYVAEALRANPGLSASRSAARRAGSALREARGRLLPAAGVNARYSAYSGVINIGDFINPAYTALNGLLGESRFPTDVSATLPLRQETRLEVVQPLFAPALLAATAAAAAQRDIAGAAVGGMTRRIAAEVQLAWLAYATSERVIETLESARGVLDEGLRVSEHLVSAGSATPDVTLRARAERSEVVQQLAEARHRRDAARRAFNLLRDADGEAPVALAADSTLVPADTLSRDAFEASALAHREELRQADGGIRLSNAGRRAAASAFLPTIALSASYGVQGNRYRFDRSNDVALASLVLSLSLIHI